MSGAPVGARLAALGRAFPARSGGGRPRLVRALVLAAVAPALLGVAPRPGRAAPRGGAAVATRWRADSGSSSAGQVRFVTAEVAFLDRGRTSGLAARQVVFLTRPGRMKHIRCVVDVVADHTATCRPPGGVAIQIGDAFRISTPRLRSTTAARRPLPAVVPAATLQARAQVIAASPHEKVDFAGQTPLSLPATISFGAGFTVWSAPAGTESTPRAAEQIDVQLRKIRLGQSGLRFDAALTAVRWQARATELRFRPVEPAQIYLWEAEVSRRELEDVTVFSFGRVWPWHLPGIPMLDGLQVGRRNLAGSAEAGVYGGLVPTALGMSPRGDLWAGGVYGALTHAGTAADVLRFVRGEARLGVRHAPVVGLVEEAELLADTTLPIVAADAGARLRYASAVEHQPVLELAHAGLRLRSTERGGAVAQLRYTGVAPEQQPLLVNELPTVRGGYHASLNAYYMPRAALQLGAFATLHVDRDSNRREGEGGVDLGAPRLLGGTGGLWFGASLGEGWLRGRTAYVQFASNDSRALRVLARMTGSTSQYAPSPTPSSSQLNLLELGGYLHVEAALGFSFRIRARASIRAPLVVQGLAPLGENRVVVSGVDAVWLL